MKRVHDPDLKLWKYPHLLCGLGNRRPIIVSNGAKFGKPDHRWTLCLSTPDYLSRRSEWVLDWIEDFLCLKSTGVWQDLKRRLVHPVRRFFGEAEHELGAWVSIESYRVPIRKRLPHMVQPNATVTLTEMQGNGTVPLMSYTGINEPFIEMPKELFASPGNEDGDRNLPVVQLETHRELRSEDNPKKRLRYNFGIHALGEPEDREHWSLLSEGKVPATTICKLEGSEGVTTSPIVNFIKMNSGESIDVANIEIHPDNGRNVSYRFAEGDLEMYGRMQDNDHDLLLKATSFLVN